MNVLETLSKMSKRFTEKPLVTTRFFFKKPTFKKHEAQNDAIKLRNMYKTSGSK